MQCVYYNPFYCEAYDCSECESFTPDCSGECETCPESRGEACRFELEAMLGSEDMTNCH